MQANVALGFPPDLRDYGIGAQIIRDLGIRELRLMTNNPTKINGLLVMEFCIVERVPIQIEMQLDDAFYLMTKQNKMDHLTTYTGRNRTKDKETNDENIRRQIGSAAA